MYIIQTATSLFDLYSTVGDIRFGNLTSFKLNKHSSTLYIGGVQFQFRYVRLCDLDIPREK